MSVSFTGSAQPMKVQLEGYEGAMADFVGSCRQREAIRKGLVDAHGFDGARGVEVHRFGARAELAVAKALGRYWPGSVNTFHAADIPPNVQVRGRVRQGAELIVRDGDSDDDVFVLATGDGDTFEVMGWTFGRDAKNQRFRSAPKGRPAAYFVPGSVLHDIRTLGGPGPA